MTLIERLREATEAMEKAAREVDAITWGGATQGVLRNKFRCRTSELPVTNLDNNALF